MVDKLFKSVFHAMDESKTVQQVTKAIGIDTKPVKPEIPEDKTLCIIHKMKKTFFCEDCLFELCMNCKDKHEKSHAVKITEEAATFVIEKFRDSLEDIEELRKKVHSATSLDPTQLNLPEGSVNILEQGNKDIDYIFEKLLSQMNLVKQDMKDRLREAYKANYRATIDQKSQKYLQQLEKQEGYVHGCLQDFEKKYKKGKYIVVCEQRPKVDDLKGNLGKFDRAFNRMCEQTTEYKGDFQIQFKQLDFQNNLKDLLNQHVQVSFPGLENGFFPQSFKKMQTGYSMPKYKQQEYSADKGLNQSQDSQKSNKMEFDPLKALEKEEYDIRRAKEFPVITPIQQQQSQAIQLDLKYELKSLKFKRDKFEVRIYDAQSKKSSAIEIPILYQRIATKFFSYVSAGRQIYMTGGQFTDDKTCSIDTYKIDLETKSLEQLQDCMNIPRMQHSMIYIEEMNLILTAGGENENGIELDSCETYNIFEKQWKQTSALNNKGKNLSLCKFIRETMPKREKIVLIYAFNRNSIERLNMSSKDQQSRWDDLKVNKMIPINLSAVTLQFDDKMILICGGQDDKNSQTQDLVFFNTSYPTLQKSQTSQLNLLDKFSGGSLTQYVVNRIEQKIYFSSDSFVHELEYETTAGETKFKSKAILY